MGAPAIPSGLTLPLRRFRRGGAGKGNCRRGQGRRHRKTGQGRGGCRPGFPGRRGLRARGGEAPEGRASCRCAVEISLIVRREARVPCVGNRADSVRRSPPQPQGHGPGAPRLPGLRRHLRAPERGRRRPRARPPGRRLRRRPDGRRRRPRRASQEAGPVPGRVLPRAPRAHAGGAGAQRAVLEDPAHVAQKPMHILLKTY